MELIDKSAVKAEIANLQATTMDKDGNFYTAKALAEYNVLCMLESFLDTLEVKEVGEPSNDLEEEIDRELDENWYGEYINLDKFRESAKHFFELGLKAQKQ